MHSDAVGHEAPASGVVPSIEVGDQDSDAPAFELASAPPFPSTARQNAGAAQETAVSGVPWLATTPHEGVGEVGSEVLHTLPALSTATHSDSLAHETAVGDAPSNCDAGDQLKGDVAPAGSGEASTQASANTLALAQTNRRRSVPPDRQRARRLAGWRQPGS
jgi:hypothetical protein